MREVPDREPFTLLERLALVPAKARERGFRWLFRRIAETLERQGETVPRLLRLARRVLVVRVIKLESSLVQPTDTSLFAFYDLNVYPISFDICWFMVWADLERQRRRLRKLQCVVVPIADHDKRGFPDGYDSIIDQESRDWRVSNIIVPMPDLLPASGGTILCEDRSQAEWVSLFAVHRYPTDGAGPPTLAMIYRETTAGLVAAGPRWGLRAHIQGLRYVSGWLAQRARGRKPIVMTLRQYDVDPERNTRLDDWAAFARELKVKGYFPIIVPDTDKALDRLPQFDGLTVFQAASWSIGLRMALYQEAYLNMFVNTGPGSLCILNSECRYLFFKVMVPQVKLASEQTLREMGFDAGKTPPFATPMQKWVWQDDTLDVLRCEFDTMVDRIETVERRAAAMATQ